MNIFFLHFTDLIQNRHEYLVMCLYFSECTYTDPFEGPSKKYQLRIKALEDLVSDTLRWEKIRKLTHYYITTEWTKNGTLK